MAAQCILKDLSHSIGKHPRWKVCLVNRKYLWR